MLKLVKKIFLRIIAFLTYIIIFGLPLIFILFILGNKGCDKWADIFFTKFSFVLDSFED